MSADNVFADAVLEGLEQESPIEFSYRKRGEKEGTRRVVSPWQINCQDCDEPTLVGYDHNKEGIRQFFLSGIHHASLYTLAEYVPPSEG